MTQLPDSVHSLATGIALLDEDAIIRACNPAFAHWLGVNERRLLSLPLQQLENAEHPLTQFITTAAPDSTIVLNAYHHALTFPDYDTRFADIFLGRYQHGWLIEAHAVEEFPGQAAHVTLPAALSAALKGLAHEIRNPLSGLKGATQLLSRRDLDAQSQTLVALIRDEVERLSTLVDNFLTPQPQQPFSALNIHSVLERVLRLTEADTAWTIKIVRDYDPSLPELSGHQDLLVQVFLNLVRNAVEAGSTQINLRTRIQHQVRIGRITHPSVVRVDVTDNGRGVPESIAEHLFLPLVSGQAEGTGLGLAVAQHIARQHDGTLVYQSRPGHTVFSVLIPIDLTEGKHA